MTLPIQWRIDQSVIFTRRELAQLLSSLDLRGRRSVSTHMNLAVVRLACCCGLRASEIVGLRLSDVLVGISKPHVHVRRANGKGRKARRVPLWWDAGTLSDIATWKDVRISQGATPTDPFVCSTRKGTFGHRLRHVLRRRFRRACRVLGEERAGYVTTHHGRHTFISHALAGGRTLAEVRDAAGHSNVSVTSAYLHVAVDDDGAVGELFRMPSA